MKKLSTIYKVNLIAFLVLNAMVYGPLLSKGGSESAIAVTIFGLAGLGLLFLINLIAAIVSFANSKKVQGQHYILSAIMVLVIGLGVCGIIVGGSSL
jgi:hypothetical protein